MSRETQMAMIAQGREHALPAPKHGGKVCSSCVGTSKVGGRREPIQNLDEEVCRQRDEHCVDAVPTFHGPLHGANFSRSPSRIPFHRSL